MQRIGTAWVHTILHTMVLVVMLVVSFFFIIFANVSKIMLALLILNLKNEEDACDQLEQARVPLANIVMFVWLGWWVEPSMSNMVWTM